MTFRMLAVPAVALLALVSMGGCKKDEAAPAPAEEKEVFGRLTLDEVETRVKAAKEGGAKFYVFDNNSKDRYAESHVPTAKWVDYKKLDAKDLPAEKDAPLVFYCSNEF